MAPLERSVLRLALFEICSWVTPPEVAIDEAVRWRKRYSTDEAGALVNGILGGVPARGAEDDAPAGGQDAVRQRTSPPEADASWGG